MPRRVTHAKPYVDSSPSSEVSGASLDGEIEAVATGCEREEKTTNGFDSVMRLICFTSSL